MSKDKTVAEWLDEEGFAAWVAEERAALKAYLIDLVDHLDDPEDVVEAVVFVHRFHKPPTMVVQTRGWCACSEDLHLVRDASKFVTTVLKHTDANIAGADVPTTLSIHAPPYPGDLS